jgi:hypothetical protein
VPKQLLHEDLVAPAPRVIRTEMPQAIRTIAMVNSDGSRRISSAIQNASLKAAARTHPADPEPDDSESERVA